MVCCDGPVGFVQDAYRRFTRDQLVLFLKVRSLSTQGTDEELSLRLAQYDVQTYRFPSSQLGSDMITQNTYVPPSPPPESLNFCGRHATLAFPFELWVEILDHLGDWELSKAVGLPTSLPRPTEWKYASRTDIAMLSGSVPRIQVADPVSNPPTELGAAVSIRFCYVHVLEYFFTHHMNIFMSIFPSDVLIVTASRHGQTKILSWFNCTLDRNLDKVRPPSGRSIAEAVDISSRDGQVVSLDWWLNSGLPFEFTEASLELASSKNRLDVLEWWSKQNAAGRLKPNHLKIGKVMDMASTAGNVQVLEWWARSQLEFKYDRQSLYHASCHGKIDVLQWWMESGLQMIFDQDALTGATKYNRPEVLEWWDKSGLPIQYRTCDIEEALEDALVSGDGARAWWKNKGVDFNANNEEWMKLQYLN